MSTSEVILMVGVELGDLTLYGRRVNGGWVFSLQVIDQTPVLLDGPEISHESEAVDSWHGAMKLLDAYPWHMMCPIEVHPEFAERALEAAVERLNDASRNEPSIGSRLHRWMEVCQGPSRDQ